MVIRMHALLCQGQSGSRSLCSYSIGTSVCRRGWIFGRSCFAKLWFSPWGLTCIYRTGAAYESFIINFLLGFHIFGESFRLQVEKLIFKTEVQPAYYPSKVSFIKNKRHTYAPHIEKTHTAKRPIKVLLYIRREALFLQAAASWSPWRPPRGQKQCESHRSFMGSGITKADCSLFRWGAVQRNSMIQIQEL